MKAKVIVSLGAVIGLTALSAAAFISTANTIPADAVSKKTAELQPVKREQVIREKPSTTMPETEKSIEQSEGDYQEIICSWDTEESYMLTKIAMAEAEGEDTEGKALVMLVVLNRVRSDRFPDSIEEVIYEDGQFSPVGNGRFDRVEPDEDCWRALSMIEADGWDESVGATYFESQSKSTWHEENLYFLFKHGAHYFYTDQEVMDD